MTGCNCLRGHAGIGTGQVSIHSRPHDRLQPGDAHVRPVGADSFNPQPAP